MSKICLKVDVDTFKGLKEGVPRLLKVFDEFNIKATFYVTLGPDNSGKAIINLLKPSFLKKMLKTKATSSYGLKTIFYGTIFKPPILAWQKDILLNIKKCSHEVEFHAWDHRYYQDNIQKLNLQDVSIWFDKGISTFFSIYKHLPYSFGAPGWVASKNVLKTLKNFKFIKFISLSRAQEPFIEQTNQLIEIPSNLPCQEEGPKNFVSLTIESLKTHPIGILPIHAEIEGGPFIKQFVKLLSLLKDNHQFLTMQQLYEILKSKNLPIREFNKNFLPGRAFSCLV